MIYTKCAIYIEYIADLREKFEFTLLYLYFSASNFILTGENIGST